MTGTACERPVIVDMFCGAGGESQGIKRSAPKFGRGGFLKIYLGVVGSSKVQAFVREHDLGWLMTPTNSRDPKEIQYCLDNGAFVDWKNGTEWNERKFLSLIKKYPDYDFVVAPDIVCGGGAIVTEQKIIKETQFCRYYEEGFEIFGNKEGMPRITAVVPAPDINHRTETDRQKTHTDACNGITTQGYLIISKRFDPE